MIQQRKVSKESFSPREEDAYWAPRVDRDGEEGITDRMGRTHWYAVVDDIAEGTVVMQIASWPKLDKGNHLHFDEIYVQTYPLDELQKAVNRERDRNRQPAADRPLRISDAFSFQSEDRPGENLVHPGYDGAILDITAAAREQAKIALYGAVAPKLRQDEADSLMEEPPKPDRFQRTKEARARRSRLRPNATARPEV